MSNELKKRMNTINYALLLPIFLLVLLSIWSQYWVAFYDNRDLALQQALKQLLFSLIGLVGMFCLRLINKKFIWQLTPYCYAFSLCLMLSLYVFYDPVMFQLTGTKRWLDIGGFQFQPSEFAKIAYILFVSRFLVTNNQPTKITSWQEDLKKLGKLLLYSLPLFGLMFMPKDFGTSLVFLFILGALIVASGMNWRIVLSLVAIASLLGGLLITLVFTDFGQHVLEALHFKTYQLNRVRAWANPFEFSNSIGYQQVQGLKAIGSGGIFGKGTLGINVYVPVRESDMIFTFIGEAYGFVGCTAVISLYFYLFYQIFSTSVNSNSLFNSYIGIGIIFMLLFQTLENIGASIGLLPLTGIPLPFLSQGGTSLIATLLALGLVLEIPPKSTVNT
ncbi:cell division protein FtsW [Vagococcus penaei]|uniref:Cell division protein FtsW n=2 Tax=Vagococcus penaei TaxID=633807 RepID=A0A1Q2D7N6_9ENTE|nr:FtsW/RodA/SpoVE family cell cycle protein [Vagococcus penaei]AQP54367.1 cell division protein FtsW [Vagococcus penaei]RSU06283.1 cell division protein FtsW [Vagococcus penaei]